MAPSRTTCLYCRLSHAAVRTEHRLRHGAQGGHCSCLFLVVFCKSDAQFKPPMSQPFCFNFSTAICAFRQALGEHICIFAPNKKRVLCALRQLILIIIDKNMKEKNPLHVCATLNTDTSKPAKLYKRVVTPFGSIRGFFAASRPRSNAAAVTAEGCQCSQAGYAVKRKRCRLLPS